MPVVRIVITRTHAAVGIVSVLPTRKVFRTFKIHQFGNAMYAKWLAYVHHCHVSLCRILFISLPVPRQTSNLLAVAISALPRLGAFAKLRKATPSFISVRPSVRAQHLSSHWTDLNEIWYLSTFRKSVVEKVRVLFKSKKNNGCFTWRRFDIYDSISLNTS